MKDLQDTRYRGTIYSCFLGIAVQAIIVNFAPLLFVTFSDSYGIPMTKITLLVTVNFLLQLCIDLCAVKFAKYISYRAMAVAAQLFAGGETLVKNFERNYFLERRIFYDF